MERLKKENEDLKSKQLGNARKSKEIAELKNEIEELRLSNTNSKKYSNKETNEQPIELLQTNDNDNINYENLKFTELPDQNDLKLDSIFSPIKFKLVIVLLSFS